MLSKLLVQKQAGEGLVLIGYRIYDSTGNLLGVQLDRPEFDDDDSLYKECIQCGQGQIPFKHGFCPKCGENNRIVKIEKPKVEKLGIKELMDN